MTLKSYSDGSILYAQTLNEDNAASLRAAGLNTVRQLIDRDVDFSAGTTDCFADAYVDTDGRENSVDTANSGLFDTNKYKTWDLTTIGPYVIIEASAFQLVGSEYNCVVRKIGYSGKWLVYCTTGTDQVKRASIYAYLFYGDATLTGQRIRQWSSITSIKTSVSRDVGKRLHLANLWVGDNISEQSIVGTFTNTSTNTDCSIWAGFQRATSTNIGPSDYVGNEAGFQFGTNTETNEPDNPATTTILTRGTDASRRGTVQLPTSTNVYQSSSTGSSSVGSQTIALVLCAGDISWASPSGGTFINIDFYSDLSIPDLTSASGETAENLITHIIPAERISSTTSSSILVPFIQDWESGADIQYKLASFTGLGPFVVIEATSVTGNWSINNCQLIRLSSTKWVVYSNAGSDEVKRSQVYKTLFYGTNGTDPRATSSYITGITALKTSVARDVGKRAYFMKSFKGTAGAYSHTGTFANTTTNLDCSAWGGVENVDLGNTNYVQMPSGTYLFNTTNFVDQTGTDMSSFEADNPTSIIVGSNGLNGGDGSRETYALVICNGTISFSSSGSPTTSTTDFTTTHSIPTFTATTETLTPAETSWLSCGTTTPISNFTAFSTQPTTLTIKLIPKSSSPTAGYPSIRGFTLFAE